jgi:hypothetical protein
MASITLIFLQSVCSGYQKRLPASYQSFSSESPHHEFDPKWTDDYDEPSPDSEKAYPTHIPTTSFQKALLSVGSAAMAITNPWRGGMAHHLFIFYMHY